MSLLAYFISTSVLCGIIAMVAHRMGVLEERCAWLSSQPIEFFDEDDPEPVDEDQPEEPENVVAIGRVDRVA